MTTQTTNVKKVGASRLKLQTMRRIRVVFAVRSLARPVVLEAGLLGACLGFLSLFVSAKQVFTNMPNLLNFSAMHQFFSVAFAHTELETQLLMVTGFAVFIFFARNLTFGILATNKSR